MYFGKTAEWMEMPFQMVDRVGPRNNVLDGVKIPREKWANLLGKWGNAM